MHLQSNTSQSPSVDLTYKTKTVSDLPIAKNSNGNCPESTQRRFLLRAKSLMTLVYLSIRYTLIYKHALTNRLCAAKNIPLQNSQILINHFYVFVYSFHFVCYGFLKVRPHVAFAFVSASKFASKFNIVSMHVHRIG